MSALFQNSTWILLLNWKNFHDTLECLDSILACQDPEISGVVVCDNGSNDGSVEAIMKWQSQNLVRAKNFHYLQNDFQLVSEVQNHYLPVYLIENGANLGFAAGNNIGLDYLKSHEAFDYVLLLNNDTVIQNNTVSAMVSEFTTCPSMGLCGSKVVYENARHIVQAYGGAKFNKWLGRAVNIGSMEVTAHKEDAQQVQQQLDYILGASMMISKPCLDAIGNMEERYFLYYEEIDWAVRAKRAGYTLGYASKSIVYHKEGASIGSSYDKATRSQLSTYYLTASKVRFTLKMYPYMLPTVLLFSSFQLIRSLFRRDFGSAKTILGAMLLRPFIK